MDAKGTLTWQLFVSMQSLPVAGKQNLVCGLKTTSWSKPMMCNTCNTKLLLPWINLHNWQNLDWLNYLNRNVLSWCISSFNFTLTTADGIKVYVFKINYVLTFPSDWVLTPSLSLSATLFPLAREMFFW